MVSASCMSAWTRSSADLDGTAPATSEGRSPEFSAAAVILRARSLSIPLPKVDSRVIGRQPLYDQGSLPGFERVTTVACLKALGKAPHFMQLSAMARAAGRTSSQVCLRKARGTPSRPGVFGMAPRKAFLSSSSLGGSASLAAHSGGKTRTEPNRARTLLGPCGAEGLCSEVSRHPLRIRDHPPVHDQDGGSVVRMIEAPSQYLAPLRRGRGRGNFLPVEVYPSLLTELAIDYGVDHQGALLVCLSGRIENGLPPRQGYRTHPMRTARAPPGSQR